MEQPVSYPIQFLVRSSHLAPSSPEPACTDPCGILYLGCYCKLIPEKREGASVGFRARTAPMGFEGYPPLRAPGKDLRSGWRTVIRTIKRNA